MTWHVALLALGSTFLFSLSTVLKHHAADHMDDGGHAAPSGRIAGFLVSMVRNPLWLVSLLADGGGAILQVLALRDGAISVVQPMLTLALVFALVMDHLSRRTPFSLREIGAALSLIGGLVLFLWASGATVPRGPDAAGRRVPAIILGVSVTALVVVCLLVARRGNPPVKAASLGVAVAAIYACTAALIKTCTRILSHRGLDDLLLSWQLWLLLLAGGLGMVLTQMAFKADPLALSLPVIASLDPLFSLVVGRVVYVEKLRGTPEALLGSGLGLVLLLGSVFVLSRLAAAGEERAQADLA